jgi:hypothetical protein
MPNLLSTFNNKADEYHGIRFAKMLVILFVIFLVLGLSIGLVVGRFSPSSQEGEETNPKQAELNQSSFEGVVTFVEPLLYPGENISFALINTRGKEVILLKAKDKKLEVSEGHYVTAYGEKYKTKDGKDEYLLVDTIVIKNAAN